MIMAVDGIVVRPIEASDVNTLYAINEASTPGVGSVSRERFTKLVFDYADIVLVAVKDDEPIGFALLMVEGNGYDSQNYNWVMNNYVTFAYVDRIAVSDKARGLGVGSLLYEKAADHFAGERPVLMAEINLEPPNPGSLKFHKRHDFIEVGERWEKDRSKGVVFVERVLPFSKG